MATSIEGMRALALALRNCRPEWPGARMAPPTHKRRQRQADPKSRPVGEFKCVKCKRVKDASAFHFNGQNLRRVCKECRNAKNREHWHGGYKYRRMGN